MNQSPANLTTSCNKCCFAEYEGDEQVGCCMREMEDASYFPAYEGNREYRVYKRLCQFKRGEDWYPDRDLLDKIDLVRGETQIRYNVFIETSPIFDNFGQALRTINRQTLQPEKIVGVDFNKQGDTNYGIMSMTKLKAKWSLQEFMETPADWRDNVMVQHKSQFYVFIKPPLILPKNYFEMLSYKINFEDLRFGCIEGDGILIFPNGLYQMRPLPLRELLTEIEALGLKRLNYEDIHSEVAR